MLSRCFRNHKISLVEVTYVLFRGVEFQCFIAKRVKTSHSFTLSPTILHLASSNYTSVLCTIIQILGVDKRIAVKWRKFTKEPYGDIFRRNF